MSFMSVIVARMAEEHFTIVYDGRALVTGRIDVRDLAPSLIGLANSISVASRILHPESAEPGLEITAQREGSFEVDLILNGIQHVWPVIQDHLSRPQYGTATELITFIGVLFGGFKYITRKSGLPVQDKTILSSGQVRITFADGSKLELPQESVAIAENPIFRKAARTMIDPIARQGVEEIKLQHPSVEDVEIFHDDVESFEFTAERSLISDIESTMTLKAVSISFARKNKWRFTEGDNSFYAKIEDDQFLANIQSNAENFVANDIYTCRIRTQTWLNDDGSLHPERTILEVITHQHGMEQGTFDDIPE